MSVAKSIDSLQFRSRTGRLGASRSWRGRVGTGPTREAPAVSRRYISIAEAAEYLGISTKFVRNLIMEGEIKGYRIGSYARHRTLRVDLDEIDEKLMQPVSPYWNDPSAKPRKRTQQPRTGSLGRRPQNRPPRQDVLPLCTCGHRATGDHTPDGVRACHAPTWVNIPGELSRDTGPCTCEHFEEDIKRRRRKPRKYQG